MLIYIPILLPIAFLLYIVIVLHLWNLSYTSIRSFRVLIYKLLTKNQQQNEHGVHLRDPSIKHHHV